MYPAELEIKHTTEKNFCFLLRFTPVDREGLSAAHFAFRKHDYMYFNFHITKFSFLRKIFHLYLPMGFFFISKLIRYARDFSSYWCFILRAIRLQDKLLRRECVSGNDCNRLLGSSMVDIGTSSNNLKCTSPKWYMIFMGRAKYSDTLHHWSDFSVTRDLINELNLITGFDIIAKLREVSIEHLQREQLANRGRLLLWTPGPVAFWSCICSNAYTGLFWTCHVSWLWVLNIPRYFHFCPPLSTLINTIMPLSKVSHTRRERILQQALSQRKF